MLTIVGGTYIERCKEPDYCALYGSGLRAAIALAHVIGPIQLTTCAGENELQELLEICTEHGIIPAIIPLNETISFNYTHPLKTPYVRPDLSEHQDIELPLIEADQVLYYGMAESTPVVFAKQMVYDPQSLIKFSDTGSKSDRLAIILNRKEATYFSILDDNAELIEIGQQLLRDEKAEVIVIKSGPQGAFVFDSTGVTCIPVFKTDSVWPIGSGDVFSAVFAWKWMLEGISAKESAYFASKYTAFYCHTQQLPLPRKPKSYQPLKNKLIKQRVYIAGPFFSVSERWLIEEIRDALISLGCEVFSPLNDLGITTDTTVAKQDLEEIKNCTTVLAVVSGLDPGTLFEIGYARAKKKRVIVLSENVGDDHLFMLRGSDCEITNDFSTAIYKASW